MTKPSPPASPPTIATIVPRLSRATIHKRGGPPLLWPRALPGTHCDERLEVAVLMVAHAHSSREFRHHS